MSAQLRGVCLVICLAVVACTASSREPTASAPSALETVWENDPFDDLAIGPLDGQNGWSSVARGGASAQVIALSGHGKVAKVAVDETTPVIVMGKDVPRQVAGFHALDLDVMVEDATFASVAKIEVKTDPRPGESGIWADKKFQIYFGDSMRVNYGASGEAITILPATQPGRWYHLRAAISLVDERLTVSVDGSVVASAIPIGRGPIVSLGLSGWDRSSEQPGASTGVAYLDAMLGRSLDLPVPGNVWCVQYGAVPTGLPCSNPVSFTTVQAAIDAAGSGDEVRVRASTYQGTGAAVAHVTKPLTITGGYAGGTSGWGSPTAGADSTFLDGQGARPAVLIAGPWGVALRNMALRGGVHNPDGRALVHTFPLHLRDGVSDGHFVVSSLLVFSSGAHALAGGTLLAGDGTTRVASGPVSVTGEVTADNVELAVGGTLAGDGALVVRRDLTWSGGTMSGSGRTVSRGTGHLAGQSWKSLVTRTFENEGTFEWTGTGALYVYSGATLDNRPSGVVDVQAASSILPYSGTGLLRNEGLLRAGRNFTIRVPFTGGRVHVLAETTTLAAGETGSMDATVEQGAVLDLTGGQARTYAGVLAGRGAGTIRLASGTISVGAGGWTLDVARPTFEWQGGTVNAGAGDELTNRATLTLTGASYKSLVGVHLHNEGTMAWSGSGALYVYGGGVLHNHAGAAFEARSDASILPYSGTSGFVNEGTVIKSGGAGNTSINVPFSGGRVEVASGTVVLGASGGEVVDLDVTVAAGAALDLTGGQAKAYRGELRARGDGVVRFQSGSIVSSGLVLDGQGSALRWLGGVFRPSALDIVNRGTVVVDGASYKSIEGVAFRNTGVLEWRGTGSIYVYGGAVLDNQGTLEAQGDASLLPYSGSSTFRSSGTLIKSGGAGMTSIRIPLHNEGALRARSGTLRFEAGLTSSGDIVLEGGDIGAPSVIDLLGGSMSGAGTVAAPVRNTAARVSPAVGGALTMSGSYTQLAGGTLQTRLAGLTDYARLVTAAGATIDGALDVPTVNGYVPSPGDTFPVLACSALAGQFSSIDGHGITYLAAPPCVTLTAQ